MTKETLKQVTKQEFQEFLMNYNGRKMYSDKKTFQDEGIFVREYTGNYVKKKTKWKGVYNSWPETIAIKVGKTFLGIPYGIKYFIKDSKE